GRKDKGRHRPKNRRGSNIGTGPEVDGVRRKAVLWRAPSAHRGGPVRGTGRVECREGRGSRPRRGAGRTTRRRTRLSEGVQNRAEGRVELPRWRHGLPERLSAERAGPYGPGRRRKEPSRIAVSYSCSSLES